MKRSLIIFIFLLSSIFNSISAQNKITPEEKKAIQAKIKSYQERYDAGERKRSFMQEYAFLLNEKGTVADLSKIADEYLQMIPIKKRYTGENWEIFEKGINEYTQASFRDLIKYWDKLSPEIQTKARERVLSLYRTGLFTERTKGKMSQEFVQSMRSDLQRVNVPDMEYYMGLLDMAIATDNNDTEAIIRLFKSHVTKDKISGWNAFSSLSIINAALNKVLESADISRCKQMLELLQPFVDKKNKKSTFNNIYGNFEGKLITLDPNYGKQYAQENTNTQLEYTTIEDGFYFNTSIGGVMTDKEYKVLKDVFSSSNDSLKHEHLHTVLQVFRYNGYTAGLEELKPLIEKNVADCKEKEEVLSRYKTYAHLAPGKPAPEFKLKDANGKEYALSSYRGKVVVVDVWATWCGGCIEKLPYFLKLWKKYKNRDDIVFLTISIDRKAAYNTWKFALPRYNLTEITSLIAPEDEGTFSADYNITGIPRYFIIDREGKIVNVYAPNPNNLKFEEMIIQTLKK